MDGDINACNQGCVIPNVTEFGGFCLDIKKVRNVLINSFPPPPTGKIAVSKQEIVNLISVLSRPFYRHGYAYDNSRNISPSLLTVKPISQPLLNTEPDFLVKGLKGA